MRYLCFHGHFYQPPRENPWLEMIEYQPGAAPWHDWNERITAESYRPNSAARIVDGEGVILDIVNNYARMSFNFGPTLLSWLEERAPDTYERILAADELGRARFSGHGPAIAQPYNHMIMPLASERDRETQVLWGLADFRQRFGRDPEGMWLPETAVDIPVLETLAAHGIRFTILEPGQVEATRLPTDADWVPVKTRPADPRQPWRCTLPSGRSIVVFLYDGPVSRAVAFENLLEDGDRFVDSVLSAKPREEGDELIHVATDGETYGHHHRFGEMALAWATRVVVERPETKLTIYGEYLETHEPTGEARIAERTAWSCSHGIGRWMEDCGCQTGGDPSWNQKWRGPLRDSLDWLRDSIENGWEEAARTLFEEPWVARDAYIEVVLDRSDENVASWLERHGIERSDAETVRRALELMEIQRHAMLMYTSCGWFFNDVSGIETVQVLRYAARVIQLAERVLGIDLRRDFLAHLSVAISNAEGVGSAADVYLSQVETSIVELGDIAAHQAVASFFTNVPAESEFGSYSIAWSSRRSVRAAGNRLVLGIVRVRSRVTTEEETFEAAVLHTGGLQFAGGLRPAGDDSVHELFEEIQEKFESLDLGTVIRRLDQEFPGQISIDSLFVDARRSVTRHLQEETLAGTETELGRLYEQFVPMVRLQESRELAVPGIIRDAAELGLNLRMRLELSADDPDLEALRMLKGSADELEFDLDYQTLAWPLEQRLTRITSEIDPENPVLESHLRELLRLLRILEIVPLQLDLWDLETALFPLVTTSRPAGVDDDLLDEIARHLGLAPARASELKTSG